MNEEAREAYILVLMLMLVKVKGRRSKSAGDLYILLSLKGNLVGRNKKGCDMYKRVRGTGKER